MWDRAEKEETLTIKNQKQFKTTPKQKGRNMWD